ncbi:MAG: hypothetical protein LBU60_05670 [Clostridiales bacterium]|jgi:hypothetical protein|nr:hypothetical protein [Clostridiales bacterium]
MKNGNKAVIDIGIYVCLFFQLLYSVIRIFDQSFGGNALMLILPITGLQTVVLGILAKVIFFDNSKKDKKDKENNDSLKFKSSDSITDSQDESDTTEQ